MIHNAYFDGQKYMTLNRVSRSFYVMLYFMQSYMLGNPDYVFRYNVLQNLSTTIDNKLTSCLFSKRI